jgi:hypothetical protein
VGGECARRDWSLIQLTHGSREGEGGHKRYLKYDIKYGWCGRVGGHTLACISLIGNGRYFGERLGGMGYSSVLLITGGERAYYLSKS